MARVRGRGYSLPWPAHARSHVWAGRLFYPTHPPPRWFIRGAFVAGGCSVLAPKSTCPTAPCHLAGTDSRAAAADRAPARSTNRRRHNPAPPFSPPFCVCRCVTIKRQARCPPTATAWCALCWPDSSGAPAGGAQHGAPRGGPAAPPHELDAAGEGGSGGTFWVACPPLSSRLLWSLRLAIVAGVPLAAHCMRWVLFRYTSFVCCLLLHTLLTPGRRGD